MVPDIFTHDKLAFEHRNALLHAAECERMLAVADSPMHTSFSLRRFVGKLGMYLIALGTSLQSFEEHSKGVKA